MNNADKTAIVINGNRRIGKAIREELDRRGVETVVSFDKAASLKNPDILIYYLETSGQAQKGRDIPLEPNFSRTPLKTIISQMRKAKKGRVVLVGDSPIAGAWKYLALRNEIIHFTKTLARSLAKDNINVNAVIPGPLEGEDYSRIEAELKTEIQHYFPVERRAKMEEIVAPVLFLASQKASYIFGQTIVVDAGFTS